MPNRLAASTSPYLRQHAENPVDWREWGEEAFAEARARDVPIFLSVGYSSCHWCHVMAHGTRWKGSREPSEGVYDRSQRSLRSWSYHARTTKVPRFVPSGASVTA
jgi:hypothetical protein